jgi:transcriptional regulator with XRE-family HTH domain
MFTWMSQIFDTIRRAIEASGKTRYRLSKETGIDQAQLSRLMSGKEGVSVENLERLADALGLEIIIRPKLPENKAEKRTAKRPERPQADSVHSRRWSS